MARFPRTRRTFGRNARRKAMMRRYRFRGLRYNIFSRILPKNSIYNYRQVLSGGSIGPINSDVMQQSNTASFYNYVFTIGDLPQFASFNALFDNYRINAVVMKFQRSTIPVTATSGLGTPGSNAIIAYVKDYDDGNALTTLDQAYEYQNCKIYPVSDINNKPIIVKIRPRYAVQLYQTSVSTGYKAQRGGWLDMSQSGVPHYGIKVALEEYFDASYKQTFRVWATYYVSFKNVK